MQEKDKDIIRAKWFEGEIETGHLDSNEAKELMAIKEATNEMAIPDMDMNRVFDRIERKIDAPKTKLFSIRRILTSAAAALIILLAFDFLFTGDTDITSNIGQSIAHQLPDESQVILNGNSELSYDKNFRKERLLNLEGEAFFEVEKGQKFTVITQNGSVQVLGTSFNVFSRGETLSVSCKTGKVLVQRGGHSHLLTPGKAVRLDAKTDGLVMNIDTSKIGLWQDGNSSFKNTPLSDVVAGLQSVYDIEIELPNKYKEQKFTGTFVHDDLAKACKMIFTSMQIKYQIDNGKRISFVD